ncbi:MAG TPA: penicillin-binding protein 1A [Geminicoccaceae bacterium]|nr:penicillin-binding protein 1A [Geminicoccus sp.]HMU50249.1 penicillin-binding protein 1A [Geminicoccaceae bacterium]
MGRVIRRLGTFLLTVTIAAIVAGGVAVWALQEYGGDLPDYRQLAGYAPPTVTRIHAGDGRLLAEYARERRVFVPVAAIPERVKQAFIAAEDQHFYSHPGIDVLGIVRAALGNIERLQSNLRPQGASTITQQVAKNFFLDNEVSIGRKLKEAILAWRIEQAFSKDHILELYLNEIYLGNRSYGVAAAALNYFDKSLDQLTISEAAYLAGLPKAPSRYDPRREPEAARERRDYVIGRMLQDGYIGAAEAAEARAEPLIVRSRAPTEVARADFFTETVRRQLVERFGEEGFYEGGFSVRATVQPGLQEISDRALRHGLAAYDRRHGWRGPVGRIEVEGDWQSRLDAFDPGFELDDWRMAVVLATGAKDASIGLADGTTASLPLSEMTWARRVDEKGRMGPRVQKPSQVVAPGDVVVVERIEGGEAAPRWTLRQRPAVEGAVVALDPHTGRVLALSGGFSFRQSKFDRATQARRQPGSSFKPFVYLAALEDGFTPASVVVDGPITFDMGPGLGLWKPQNYSEQYYGPSTLRLGLEKSRNLMTVRLAMDIGMDKVVDVARRFDIAQGLAPYLSGALGASEVDLMHLTTAYAMLVNGGKRVEPSFVERIQDRNGATVMRRDGRACDGCRAPTWSSQAPPVLVDDRPQVEDPRYAFQMVNMLEGVIERGTATDAARLGRPLAGKTGTTNDSKDAWFVGFSPDLVVGVWVGFDQPRSLGGKETGGSAALPIWIEVMQEALKDEPPVPFRTPPGVSIVRVDAATGLLPGPGTKSVIAEAFLPGTEPYATSSGGGGTAGAGWSGEAPRTSRPLGAGGLY